MTSPSLTTQTSQSSGTSLSGSGQHPLPPPSGLGQSPSYQLQATSDVRPQLQATNDVPPQLQTSPHASTLPSQQSIPAESTPALQLHEGEPTPQQGSPPVALPLDPNSSSNSLPLQHQQQQQPIAQLSTALSDDQGHTGSTPQDASAASLLSHAALLQAAPQRRGLRPPPAPPSAGSEALPGRQASTHVQNDAPQRGGLRPPPAPPGHDSCTLLGRQASAHDQNLAAQSAGLRPPPAPPGDDTGMLLGRQTSIPDRSNAGVEGVTVEARPAHETQYSLGAPQVAGFSTPQMGSGQFQAQFRRQPSTDSLQAAAQQHNQHTSTQQQLNTNFAQTGWQQTAQSTQLAEQRQSNAGFAQSRQQPSAESIQLAEQRQSNADFAQAASLQSMLGRSMPDTQDEASESDVSAQDRQKFVQSLQSPDKGSKAKGLAKGFTRMKARAKDMLQSGSQGSSSSQAGASDGTASNAGLSRGSKMARDMTTMFGGLKRPAHE